MHVETVLCLALLYVYFLFFFHDFQYFFCASNPMPVEKESGYAHQSSFSSNILNHTISSLENPIQLHQVLGLVSGHGFNLNPDVADILLVKYLL